MQRSAPIGTATCELVRIRHLDPAIQILGADFILHHRAERHFGKHDWNQLITSLYDGWCECAERQAEWEGPLHTFMFESHGLSGFGEEVDDLSYAYFREIALQLD